MSGCADFGRNLPRPLTLRRGGPPAWLLTPCSQPRDLEFMKDQITITEVSVARLYNYDVEERRKAKLGAGASTSS